MDNKNTQEIDPDKTPIYSKKDFEILISFIELMSHLVLKDEEKFLSHFEIIKSLLQNEQLGANNNKN